MKKNIILFIALVITFSATAQKIEGLVTDTDGEPLLGANVLLNPGGFGTTSGIDGKFSFDNLPSGFYTLEISYIGYIKATKRFELRDNVFVEFSLQSDLSELQTVEVFGRRARTYKNNITYSSTKFEIDVAELPQSVSFVTKELISDQKAYRVSETVKNVSGVNQFSFNNDFTIRGFRNSANLINGLRANFVGFEQPLLVNIERIEVVKGPSSITFADASPGGNINMVTKKPLKEERSSFDFTVGSYNNIRASADVTGPLNKEKTILYRANVGYEDTESFRDLQEKKSYVFAPSLSFLPNENTRLNVELVVSRIESKLDRGQPIFGATAGTDLESTPISFAIGQSGDFFNNDYTTLTASLFHKLNDNLNFNATYMRFLQDEDLFETRTSNRFAVDGDGNQIPTLMELQIIDRQRRLTSDNLSTYFVANYKTGQLEHKIVAGFDFIDQRQSKGGTQTRATGFRKIDGSIANSFNPAQKDDFMLDENGNPIPNVPFFNLENPNFNLFSLNDIIFNRLNNFDPTRIYTMGVYFQDLIKYKKLSLLLGIRKEWFNEVLNFDTNEENRIQQNTELFRAGLLYDLTPNINIYGSYIEGFEPQSASVQNNTFGGPFDPQESEMIEGGIKTQWFNNRLLATASVYRIEQNNVLVNANDPGNPDLLEQRGQQVSKGFELDAVGSILTNLSVNFNYAYNDSRITESDNVEEEGRRVENAPFHQMGFWGKYSFNKGYFNGFGLGFGGNYVGERNTFDTFRVVNGQELGLILPDYFVMDAALFYQYGNFKLQLNVNNLANRVHHVGGFSFVRLFPGTPRNWMASVSYSF